MNEQIKTDLFGQMEELNKYYEEKFLNEIHPLIKKYHNTTGNDFRYDVRDEIIIQYESGHYWICEGGLFTNKTPHQTRLWFDKEGVDNRGRKFGGKHDRDGWFNLVARLCCKYEKEIKSKIEFDLKEMMK